MLCERLCKVIVVRRWPEGHYPTCPSGGIGRRAALKMRFFTECGFESHLGHQQVKSEPCTVHNVLRKARFSLFAGHDMDRVSFTARGSPSLPYSGPPGPLDVGAVQRAIGGGGQAQEKARGTEERGRLERPQHQGQSQGLLATLHIAAQVLRL